MVKLEYKIGDCLELMKDIDDNHFDLVLTDPPYGIGEAAGKNKSRGSATHSNKWKNTRNTTGAGVPATYFIFSDWDNKRISSLYFAEIFRISKNQIIFGGNYYIDYLFPSSCWIVWDKDNTGDFADCELAWTSFKTAVRKFKFRWNGMLQEDMKNKEERLHPTQKPVALFKWILENYSKEGDLICDPFLGSGTTLRACRETNRNCIGFEKEQKYESIIRKRAMLDTPSLSEY